MNREHQNTTCRGQLGGALIIAILSVAAAKALPAAEIAWKVGDEFHQELLGSDALTWTARPIRDGIRSLSASQRVACWLDRRIDPSQELTISIEGPLNEIFQQLAGQLKGSVGYVGPVAYIGPPNVAAKLWTVAELRAGEVERLPADLRAKWGERQPVQWELLSTPRELLAKAVERTGCTIEDLDGLPHDLWPAADLPPLSVAERLTLILAGFDRTFSIDAERRTIRLVPLPENPQLEKQYVVNGEPARVASELARNFPDTKIQRSGNKLQVTGIAENQDAIRRLLQGEKIRRPKGPPEVRYQLEVKNQPLGAVLRKIEMQAKLQMSTDEFANVKLRELVTFKVENATLEQLLQAALQGTGLTFQLNGNQLRITKSTN